MHSFLQLNVIESYLQMLIIELLNFLPMMWQKLELTYHILKKAGLNVGIAGNVGLSFAQQVLDNSFDIYVLELSSFQLDDIVNFSLWRKISALFFSSSNLQLFCQKNPNEHQTLEEL